MSYVIVENNTIIFDKDFDLDLDEYYVVLLTVKHIKFGTFFNKMVDKLPENIETIHFGDYFNQPVDNLPESVKGITFGAMFNKTIDLLPCSLQYLELGEQFNKSLDNLPVGLTTLILNCVIFNSIDNLPMNLKFLCLSSIMINENDDDDDRSTFYINKFPKGLTHLIIGENNMMVYISVYLENVPESVIFLVANVKFFGIDHLPKNLVYLHLGKFIENPIIYPETLKYLVVNNIFMIEEDSKELPDTLEYIEIKENFFSRKFKKVPSNLKKIICQTDEIINLPSTYMTEMLECYGNFCVPVNFGLLKFPDLPDAKKYYNTYPCSINEFRSSI